jgi:hypothetical protein
MLAVAVVTISAKPMMICWQSSAGSARTWPHSIYREWSQADYDQRTVDNVDALRRCLQELRLGRQHVDIGDNLLSRERRNKRQAEGYGRQSESAERNHGCGGVEWLREKDIGKVGYVDGVGGRG